MILAFLSALRILSDKRSGRCGIWVKVEAPIIFDLDASGSYCPSLGRRCVGSGPRRCILP